MTLIEIRKSRDIQSGNDYDEKIHIFRLFVGTFLLPCYFYETKSLHIWYFFLIIIIRLSPLFRVSISVNLLLFHFTTYQNYQKFCFYPILKKLKNSNFKKFILIENFFKFFFIKISYFLCFTRKHLR